MRQHERQTDERTIALTRRVRGEAYLVVMALLLVSLFWKSYGLGLPVTACVTELVVLAAGVVYLVARGAWLGNRVVDGTRAARRLEHLWGEVHRPAGRPLPGGAGGDLPGLRRPALPGLLRPGPGRPGRAEAPGEADTGRRGNMKNAPAAEGGTLRLPGRSGFRGWAQGPSMSAAKASSWACKLAPWPL